MIINTQIPAPVQDYIGKLILASSDITPTNVNKLALLVNRLHNLWGRCYVAHFGTATNNAGALTTLKGVITLNTLNSVTVNNNESTLTLNNDVGFSTKRIEYQTPGGTFVANSFFMLDRVSSGVRMGDYPDGEGSRGYLYTPGEIIYGNNNFTYNSSYKAVTPPTITPRLIEAYYCTQENTNIAELRVNNTFINSVVSAGTPTTNPLCLRRVTVTFKGVMWFDAVTTTEYTEIYNALNAY
jgi:hypothetical protein